MFNQINNNTVNSYNLDLTSPKNLLDIKKAWIITRTGKKVTPLAPDFDSIDIIDIAWALSSENRFANHTIYPYSVGQHSYLLADYAIEKGYSSLICRSLLLHDATEAYIKDLPYLLKPFFPDYVKMEKNMAAIIEKKFDLDLSNPIIHNLDRRIAAREIKSLMPNVEAFEIVQEEPLDVYLYCLDHINVFHNFLTIWELCKPDWFPGINWNQVELLIEEIVR